MTDTPQPPQHQEHRPGDEHRMEPRPRTQAPHYRAAGKLTGRVALIAGGDSGIGRAVVRLFAAEGAEIAFIYLDEHRDALGTRAMIEAEGRRCLAIAGDIADSRFCADVVARVAAELGRLDILVNNATVQYPQDRLEDISEEQLEQTFRTNILSMFHLSKAALTHPPSGGSIIKTTSVTAYRGMKTQIDYGTTKGAIVSFTRSLALNLAPRGIRVNAVAPGPIWTPLIPASLDAERTAEHGTSVSMEHPGQPDEVTPAYVFLAAEDASFVSGQVIHVNGGEVVNG